jgi:hypothetical protein
MSNIGIAPGAPKPSNLAIADEKATGLLLHAADRKISPGNFAPRRRGTVRTPMALFRKE